MMAAHTFNGFIAGLGTEEGTRLVVGHWPSSPLGAFTDVMVERADGHRLLLAPSEAVAKFVTATYHFDEQRLVPVTTHVRESAPRGASYTWSVEAGPLDLTFSTGVRTPLGALLHAVPRVVTTSPIFCRVADLPARMVGLRTAGTAGGGRREFYGAYDIHSVISLTASWDGADLGALRPVTPPVRFGFGSTPAHPSVTSVVTTVVTP